MDPVDNSQERQRFQVELKSLSAAIENNSAVTLELYRLVVAMMPMYSLEAALSPLEFLPALLTHEFRD